jgi:hypothetical protein
MAKKHKIKVSPISSQKNKNVSSRKKTSPFMIKEKRLRNEIDKLIDRLYNTNEKKNEIRYDNLKTYRIEIIRGFIVYSHLAIEDLLKEMLIEFLKHQSRIFKVAAIKKSIKGMRSSEIIEWSARLNLINVKQYKFIKDLTSVRNKCSHNWIIDIPENKMIIKQKIKEWKKTPVIRFRNKNLLNPKIFSSEFWPELAYIYLQLLRKLWRKQGYHSRI